jgi:thiamine kinase-like enzyme
VLLACFEFHDLGLVHNDLHWANIVFNYHYDPATHQVTLLPDQIRLIDFEFALQPPHHHQKTGFCYARNRFCF